MRVLTISILLTLSLVISGQKKQSLSLEKITESINTQLELYPQEKIYLHLDRDYYIPGEKIWFKAYLVDAFSHLSPVRSRYIYVELISPTDTLISRVMIRPDEENMHYGHIFLSEIIPEGDYTIRAYTKYMENLGDDYFFKKNIRIGNLPSDATTSDKNTKRKKRAPKEDYDVSFYPEGGNMLDGTLCRIAFKALNNKGFSENISGEIIDEEGTTWATVNTSHAGMGLFSFIPAEGKTYYLNCRNSKGISKQFKLPQAVPDAQSVLAYWRNKKLFVSLQKSANVKETSTSYLLVHNKGLVIYFEPWDYSRPYLLFSEEQLPAGVSQIVLFDKQMNPLSERLVFSKNFQPEMAELTFKTDKEQYETRDFVSSHLKVTDTDGLSLLSNISISITDDKDITVGSESILSTLLLTSELKGNIESPGYYFEDDNERRTVELDLLMMTHGWRRYNIPEVVKENFQKPQKAPEESQQLSGVVKSLFLSKPIANSEVTIFTSNSDIAQTEADENGWFLFSNYEYPDSTTYFVQSLGKKGSSRVDLVIDQETTPELKHMPYNPILPVETEVTDTLTDNAFMEKAEQRAKYNEEMRVVHLKNIDIVAPLKKKEEKNLPWYVSSSDATIDRKQIEQRNPVYVTDMLYSVAGVRVSGNGLVTIRGTSTLGNTLPLVLVDGIPMEWPDPNMFMSRYDSPLESVSIHDVERIDVFKGAQAAVFGMRGANGAISITTRRGIGGLGGYQSFNQTVLSPLGYQKPVEFYSPKYDTPELKHTGMPDFRTTILWKPDIITDENGEASFDFYTSDFPSTYSVIIEGVTMDGKMVRGIEKIHVMND